MARRFCPALVLVLSAVISISQSCPEHCSCQNLSESLGTLCPARGLLFVPPDIDRLTVELRLGGNSILSISQMDFANMSSLVDLTLSRNTISFVQPFSFSDLGNLRSLHMDHNRLTELGPDDLKGLMQLQHLVLNNNQLVHIDMQAFQDLAGSIEDLDLSFNSLTSLPWASVRQMSSLHQLSLDHNLLAFIPEGTFTELERLARLDLTSNRLQKLPPDPVFSRAQDYFGLTTPSVSELWLSLAGNPLHCNCELRWFRRLVRTDELETCASPSHLRGRYFWSLEEEELQCQPPQITQHTRQLLALEGQSTIFRCQASGDPLPSIHWIAPDERLVGNTSRTLLHADGSLEIRVTTAQDSGSFTCIAASLAGESSASVELSIHQIPLVSKGNRELPWSSSGQEDLPQIISGQEELSQTQLSDITSSSQNGRVPPQDQAGEPGSVSVSEISAVSALVRWSIWKNVPRVKIIQLQYNCSEDQVPIYRMVPASSKSFLLSNLISGNLYELCVLVGRESFSSTRATELIGCQRFQTSGFKPVCQALQGGSALLIVSAVIVALLLLFVLVLTIWYTAGNHHGPVLKMSDTSQNYSQTNGGTSIVLRTTQLITEVQENQRKCGSLQSSPPSSSASSDSIDDATTYSLNNWRSSPVKPQDSQDQEQPFQAIRRAESLSQTKDQQQEASVSSAPSSSQEPLMGRTLDSRLLKAFAGLERWGQAKDIPASASCSSSAREDSRILRAFTALERLGQVKDKTDSVSSSSPLLGSLDSRLRGAFTALEHWGQSKDTAASASSVSSLPQDPQMGQTLDLRLEYQMDQPSRSSTISSDSFSSKSRLLCASTELQQHVPAKVKADHWTSLAPISLTDQRLVQDSRSHRSISLDKGELLKTRHHHSGSNPRCIGAVLTTRRRSGNGPLLSNEEQDCSSESGQSLDWEVESTV